MSNEPADKLQRAIELARSWFDTKVPLTAEGHERIRVAILQALRVDHPDCNEPVELKQTFEDQLKGRLRVHGLGVELFW